MRGGSGSKSDDDDVVVRESCAGLRSGPPLLPRSRAFAAILKYVLEPQRHPGAAVVHGCHRPPGRRPATYKSASPAPLCLTTPVGDVTNDSANENYRRGPDPHQSPLHCGHYPAVEQRAEPDVQDRPCCIPEASAHRQPSKSARPASQAGGGLLSAPGLHGRRLPPAVHLARCGLAHLSYRTPGPPPAGADFTPLAGPSPQAVHRRRLGSRRLPRTRRRPQGRRPAAANAVGCPAAGGSASSARSAPAGRRQSPPLSW